MTAVATVVSALATVVIAWFTVVLTRVGDRQARIMTAVEGPAPVISSIKLVEYTNVTGPSVTDPVPPGPIPQFCRVLPEIYNLGRTPANVTQFSLQWAVSEDLPDIPRYTNIKNVNLRIERSTRLWIRIDPDGDIPLTDAERQLIQLQRSVLWAYGFFAYQHLLGETYHVGFLARWNLAAGFQLEARPNYTYEKRP
jgi:hypothetical protein